MKTRKTNSNNSEFVMFENLNSNLKIVLNDYEAEEKVEDDFARVTLTLLSMTPKEFEHLFGVSIEALSESVRNKSLLHESIFLQIRKHLITTASYEYMIDLQQFCSSLAEVYWCNQNNKIMDAKTMLNGVQFYLAAMKINTLIAKSPTLQDYNFMASLSVQTFFERICSLCTQFSLDVSFIEPELITHESDPTLILGWSHAVIAVYSLKIENFNNALRNINAAAVIFEKLDNREGKVIVHSTLQTIQLLVQANVGYEKDHGWDFIAHLYILSDNPMSLKRKMINLEAKKQKLIMRNTSGGEEFYDVVLFLLGKFTEKKFFETFQIRRKDFIRNWNNNELKLIEKIWPIFKAIPRLGSIKHLMIFVKFCRMAGDFYQNVSNQSDLIDKEALGNAVGFYSFGIRLCYEIISESDPSDYYHTAKNFLNHFGEKIYKICLKISPNSPFLKEGLFDNDLAINQMYGCTFLLAGFYNMQQQKYAWALYNFKFALSIFDEEGLEPEKNIAKTFIQKIELLKKLGADKSPAGSYLFNWDGLHLVELVAQQPENLEIIKRVLETDQFNISDYKYLLAEYDYVSPDFQLKIIHCLNKKINLICGDKNNLAELERVLSTQINLLEKQANTSAHKYALLVALAYRSFYYTHVNADEKAMKDKVAFNNHFKKFPMSVTALNGLKERLNKSPAPVLKKVNQLSVLFKEYPEIKSHFLELFDLFIALQMDDPNLAMYATGSSLIPLAIGLVKKVATVKVRDVDVWIISDKLDKVVSTLKLFSQDVQQEMQSKAVPKHLLNKLQVYQIGVFQFMVSKCEINNKQFISPISSGKLKFCLPVLKVEKSDELIYQNEIALILTDATALIKACRFPQYWITKHEDTELKYCTMAIKILKRYQEISPDQDFYEEREEGNFISYGAHLKKLPELFDLFWVKSTIHQEMAALFNFHFSEHKNYNIKERYHELNGKPVNLLTPYFDCYIETILRKTAKKEMAECALEVRKNVIKDEILDSLSKIKFHIQADYLFNIVVVGAFLKYGINLREILDEAKEPERPSHRM